MYIIISTPKSPKNRPFLAEYFQSIFETDSKIDSHFYVGM